MSHQVLTFFLRKSDMDPPMFNLVQKAIPPALARDGKGRAAIYYRSWFFDKSLRDLTPLGIVPAFGASYYRMNLISRWACL